MEGWTCLCLLTKCYVVLPTAMDRVSVGKIVPEIGAEINQSATLRYIPLIKVRNIIID